MAVTLSRNVRVRYVFMLDEITTFNQLVVQAALYKSVK